jgi:DNA-binding CsgD family transcriptional regulator
VLIHKKDADPLMDLYNSSSLEQLNENFEKICENYCIETFALAILLKRENAYSNQGKLFSTFDSYPAEWKIRYSQNKYFLYDPVFLEAQNITMPYYWHIDKFDNIESNQKTILSEACEFGIKRGTTIPLLPNGRFTGTLTLVDTNIYHPEAIYSLASASQVYFNRKEYLDLKNKLSTLTDKEMMVISLRAEGYSAKQIALELRLSDSTVLFHLKNIRKKLGLTTTEQVMLKYVTANIEV